ncbi:hypothetical protein RKE29_04515 [Streptomyces sp. B1866]|uniref:hypothetical protein n=1 Tax=Streptomyces sp. B1866 TaxID=3075431 RepID=UPI00289023B5|nr:hypothetical protein [Streptomyces sp. B1866]MDT3395913.1 hypothetical protein [Streptomyces sp. B1866]
MIRLMAWNIQRFSTETLYRVWNGSSAYIVDTVCAVDQGSGVDIFSLIEVQTDRNRDEGWLITGGGKTGVLDLLGKLREVNDNWCVVPPVLLNNAQGSTYSEGIAVFFRNDRVKFVGPNYFKGENKASVDFPPQHQYPYPQDWQGALPDAIQYAPRVVSLNAEGDFLQSRRGMHATYFHDRKADRTLRLFSVHLTPGDGEPTQRELGRALGHSEFVDLKGADVAVLAGDVNFSTTKKNLSLHEEGCSFKGFRQVPDYRENPTMVETVDNATLAQGLCCESWTGAGKLYRYQMSLSGGKGPGGKRKREQLMPGYLDNAYVRYAPGRTPPGDFRPRVVDRVRGIPGYPTAMFQDIATLEELFPDPDEQKDEFQNGRNYGSIGPNPGVSDHLPIVIDIP